MKRIQRKRTILLFLLTAAACGALGPQAAVSIYVSPEQLAEQAPLIVEATVQDVRSGHDPETGKLATYVTLNVHDVLRGPSDIDELVVRELGGEWDGVVHQLDAVPTYRTGERVISFLESRADGSLRTNNMFFGKFSVDRRNPRGPSRASRDLEGQGTIVGLPQRIESLSVNDLVAVSSSISLRPEYSGRQWQARPAEWSRLEWQSDAPSIGEDSLTQQPRQSLLHELERREDGGDTMNPDFGALSLSSPSRWTQSDSGASVIINVQPDNNPLSSDSAAVTQIGRALDAWNEVSNSRLSLSLGSTNYDYTTGRNSPASNYSGINVVLFDDPYDDISDPNGCGGVLAIGGYWRSGSTGTQVNNLTFHPALQLYVIFNNNFECFLGVADNLAEVATHEIGHGIGFGHSTVADAIMRSSAYGNRGARLGDDDEAAAHCHYPHDVSILYPNGGESLTAGTIETIQWAVTSEVSGDAGTIDLEYSTDGGSSWLPIVTETANDGNHSWLVPAVSSTAAMLRAIRPAITQAPYPTICSGDASDDTLSIEEASPIAGSVSGASVRLVQLGNGELNVEWSGSCSEDASDYAIYEGDLTTLRAGSWNHQPLTCSAGNDLQESFTPASGFTYYLIAPRTTSAEGGLGADSYGTPRPQSSGACAVRESGECPS
jgi:hypothetical protein